MLNRFFFLKVFSLILSLITCSTAQAPATPGPIAFTRDCPDNLSCPRDDGTLQCYSRSQLCNGNQDCVGGSDEGLNLNALDCTGIFTGRTTAPIASFVCGAGVVVELDELCDGVDDCGGGDDEETALCENKCLFPYYGSCSFSRECIFTDLDLNCGLCRPGWARNPAVPFGECLFARFRFSLTTFSVDENNGPLVGSITLDTAGQLDRAISVVVQTNPTGSAIPGTDYIPIVTTLLFPVNSVGGTTINFEVPIIDDPNCENSETFGLSATIVDNLGNFTAGGDTATGVIIDNDNCFIGFQFPDYTVPMEGITYTDVCLVTTGIGQLTSSCQVQVSLAQSLFGQLPSGKTQAMIPGDATLLNPMDFTFGPGQATIQCLNIQIEADAIAEGSEVFQVNVNGLGSGGSPCDIDPSTDESQVCIPSGDIEFEFSEDVYNVVEGGPGFVLVCVDLINGFIAVDTPITLTTNDISANADIPDQYGCIDYFSAPNPNPIIFPAGTSPGVAGATQCSSITINDDNCCELTESFGVTASSNDPDVMFPNGDFAIVNIEDNDFKIFGFIPTSVTVPEGATAELAIQIVNNVVVTAAVSPVTATYKILPGGTATGGGVDHNGVDGTVVFPPGSGQGSQQPIVIQTFDDNNNEPTETILIEGCADAPDTFAPNMATVVIIDDDVCEVGFEMSTYSVLESAGMVEFCLVKLNNVQLSGPVDVLISTSASPTTADKDPATAGSDYVVKNSDVIQFTTGSTRECHIFTVIDDTNDERTENFMLSAVSSNSASLAVTGITSAEVCIQDNDLIVFEFDMSVYTIEEGGPAIQVCINLVEGTLTRDVFVDVDNVIGQGTATLNMDYVVVNQPLLFPSGSSSGPPPSQQCFPLQTIDDFNVEDTEFFFLSATSPDPEAEFTPGGDTARVDIIDNDLVPIRIVPAPGLGIPDFTILESNGPQQVCVEIQNPFGQDHLEKSVFVTLSTADGTATSPADYSAIFQQFIFTPANQNDQLCVNIPIINDVICEGDEVFTVSLTSTDNCVNILMPSQGSVTIVDDDVAVVGPDLGVVHYNVTERLDDAVWIPIRLNGQKGPGRQCVVEVRTMDGTASAGMDYTSMTTTLTFDNANDLQTFHVEILDDTICEGHESFSVYLSTSSEGCQISENELIVYIWDDELHFGDDPHFSIALPGGKLLCYTVQGEHGFSFNLINNEMIVMNSKFVPDARRSEVTWLGSMGIIVQDSQYKGSNSTKLRFESSEKKIYIDDKVSLEAKNIEKLTFSNGKLSISEAPPATGFRYPSVMVDLQDVEISFTIKFTNQHLDMYWHSTGKKIIDSHGLIGQFFRDGVEIDEVRKILIMPSKEPIPVMRRPVWAFMEREDKDDQLCWTAMNPGYQGEGLIDGSYFDYLVDDVMSTDFKFNKQ